MAKEGDVFGVILDHFEIEISLVDHPGWVNGVCIGHHPRLHSEGDCEQHRPAANHWQNEPR